MKAVAYILDGNPRLAWPVLVNTEVLDDDGVPTGEIRCSDTTQEIIDALPPGTAYDLVDYEVAEVWWRDNQPKPTPEELGRRFDAAIDAKLAAFIMVRKWESLDRVLAQRGEFATDAATVQDAYDKTWGAAILLRPQVMDGTLPIGDALAQLPVLAWPDAAKEQAQ